MHTDNSAATRDLCYNPDQHHERTKHIARRHFWIRELVEDGMLVVPLVATEFNLADFFTEAASSKALHIPTQSNHEYPEECF